MQTLPFPGKTAVEPAIDRLVEILQESAYLLQASRDSDDVEVRNGSIDLAIRSLQAASMALQGDEGKRRVRPVQPRRAPGRVIAGPWGSSLPNGE